jgi:hypothetical protein
MPDGTRSRFLISPHPQARSRFIEKLKLLTRLRQFLDVSLRENNATLEKEKKCEPRRWFMGDKVHKYPHY